MGTLEQIIREKIGETGTQLPEEEYEKRIDNNLDIMTVKELLHEISEVLGYIDL